MASKREIWQTISWLRMVGLLDTRSRPADIPPFTWRWKTNFLATDESKLCRRDGFLRAFSNQADVNGVYQNWDWHFRGAKREPINFGFESTDTTGKRRLFAGTQSTLGLLNDTNGTWTTLLTGKGSTGSYWQAAELNDQVLFTNGVDDIQAYDINLATIGTVSDLITKQIKSAKVIAQFGGFMILMNIVAPPISGGPVVARPTTIQWSDFGAPLSWIVGATLANFQDLPYGDEILAAKELFGSLLIYTRRAIWKMALSGDPATVFTFQQIYSEPENQLGCLVYPRTLVSTGKAHYYVSREAIYTFNLYMEAPARPDQATTDWMHRASGVIFRKADTAFSGNICASPCAAFRPLTKELWFSWPTGTNLVNDICLVAQLEQQTADVVDTGVTEFVNFRPNPVAGILCNETQLFLAASGTDYCWKEMGGAFYREMATLVNGDPTADLASASPPLVYQSVGYNGILRGMIPTGLTDRPKTIRNVLLDHDSTAQDVPCNVRCRIGNSYNLVDPNDPDTSCVVQWRDLGTRPLDCPDGATIAQMTAKNQKPSLGMQWSVHEANRFLWIEITVENKDGTPAIGGDSCFQRLDFDVKAEPKSVTV